MHHSSHVTLSVLLVHLLSPATFSAQDQPPHANFGGALYRSVFYGSIPEYDTPKLNTEGLSASIDCRVKQYISRRKSFRSRLTMPKNPQFPEMCIYDKRRSTEKAIVSLIDVGGIEEVAYKYASTAKLYYEWEGYSDGPLGEAKFAEEYLKTNPQTPIKDYLILFLVHRYRCAFECLSFEKKLEDRQRIAQDYHNYLNEALRSADPLTQLVAEDIDHAEYLYIKSDDHP
jgi:hypothetical protein